MVKEIIINMFSGDCYSTDAYDMRVEYKDLSGKEITRCIEEFDQWSYFLQFWHCEPTSRYMLTNKQDRKIILFFTGKSVESIQLILNK